MSGPGRNVYTPGEVVDFLNSSPLRQVANLFRVSGLELLVSREAIDAMITEAGGLGTGARALREVASDQCVELLNVIPEPIMVVT